MRTLVHDCLMFTPSKDCLESNGWRLDTWVRTTASFFPWLILENLISQGPKSWKPCGGQIRKIYCGFPPISVKASEYFPKGQPYVSIWPSPLTARHYLGGGSLFKMPRLGPTTSNSPDLRTVFAMPKQGYGLQRKAVQFRGWVRTVWLSYPK